MVDGAVLINLSVIRMNWFASKQNLKMAGRSFGWKKTCRLSLGEVGACLYSFFTYFTPFLAKNWPFIGSVWRGQIEAEGILLLYFFSNTSFLSWLPSPSFYCHCCQCSEFKK